MPAVAWVAVAFLAGTLPSPYLLALAAGRREVIALMRRQDSPGDAHFLVANKISKTAGVVAITLDILKGFVPALYASAAGASPMTLAFVGLAGVVGHSFAPFLRASGGRGLTTAAGVSLAIIPRAMVGTGVIALVGTVARMGGQGTALGFALLPILAAIFGYAGPLVGMAAGIFGLIAIRRLEGIEEDRRAGIPLGRAVLARVLFDLPRGRFK